MPERNTHTHSKFRKLGRWLRRPLLAVLLAAFVGTSVLIPFAQSAKALDIGVPNPVPFLPDPSFTVPGTGGGSSGSTSTSREAGSGRYFKSVGWNQIDSVDDARQFFGVSRNSDNLLYRLRIGPYRLTTSDQNSIRSIVRQTKKKPAIEVFRMVRSGSGVAYIPVTEYGNPTPSDHRNLTLRFGMFGQSDRFASALDTFAENSGGITGLATSLGGSGIPGAISGAFDGVFGGEDSHAVWVFSGDGNNGVQNTLTCDDQDNRGSRFVFSENEPPITAARNKELTDEQRIANINRIGSGSGYSTQNFDESSLAAYLCSPKSKEAFDKLCQDELDLPPSACPSDERGFLDALGGLLPNLDPLAWALNKLRDIVGAFMGLIVEGLRSIIDIGNLGANAGVTEAWKVMRDLVNILFVLVLVALAFSTMLRLDEKKYSVRALLPRLIFAIIGVNFSLLFMTILVNAATIVGNPFLSGLNSILDQNPASNVDSFTSIGGAGQQMVLLLASIAVAVVLLLLLLLFLVRIVMIWVLGAIAPFAFLFSVLPFSRSLAVQWLKQTLKWVFMAPVSLAILWIGSLFLATADSFGATILSVLIFIGVVAAAVIIPLRLGGEIMQRAASGGKAVGKRGGLGIADRIPTGKKGSGAPSLGTRIRGTSAALKAREELGQARGQEYFQDRMAEGKGVGRLAGATAGQQTRAKQQALNKAQQELSEITSPGKRRIAYAKSGIPGTLGADGEVFDHTGKSLGKLTEDESQFAKSQISAEAAYADLAKAGQDNPELAQAYAPSGLAQLNEHNPALASIQRDGSYSQTSANNKIQYANADTLKKIEPEFWEAAADTAEHIKSGGSIHDAKISPYQRTAYLAAQRLDASRAAHAVAINRDKLPMEAQRSHLARFAKAGGFQRIDAQGNLAGVDANANEAVLDSHDKDENAMKDTLRKKGYMS